MKYFASFMFWASLLQLSLAQSSAPEQVHIALGTDETEMLVTWATMKSINDTPQVEYGSSESNLNLMASAEITHFTDDNATLFTYRSLLIGLKPETQYYYRVGSKGSSWSRVFHFKTLQSGSKWLPRLAIYGDLGYENDTFHEQSLPFLSRDVGKDMYDAIFHIGDIAYDMYERNGEQGNDFMRSIENVASRVPYQVCPGNHESHNNFSHYDAHFSMLGDRHSPNHKAPLSTRINNHFHSVDIGPAHIIMFSTEFYQFTKYGWDQIERQFHYLEEDLKRAHANRAERPWIIVMGHRPLYCLVIIDSSCHYSTLERPKSRLGIHMHDDKNSPIQYGLEELFYKYGVDIQLYGHDHHFVRLFPMYNLKFTEKDHPYTNPEGPVHIITGSAGNREGPMPFNPIVNSTKWVAAHRNDYGYTRILFKDRLHILLEQTSDAKDGTVIDSVDIIKQTDSPKWLL